MGGGPVEIHCIQSSFSSVRLFGIQRLYQDPKIKQALQMFKWMWARFSFSLFMQLLWLGFQTLWGDLNRSQIPKDHSTGNCPKIGRSAASRERLSPLNCFPCFMLLVTVEIRIVCVARKRLQAEQKKTHESETSVARLNLCSYTCTEKKYLEFGIWDLLSVFGFCTWPFGFGMHMSTYSWRRNSHNGSHSGSNSTLQNCEGPVCLMCLFGKLFSMNILSGLFSLN